MRTVLDEYNCVLDYPAVMYYDKLYEAYPDAKFILVLPWVFYRELGSKLSLSFIQTTRDPAKWEVSMKATILPVIKAFHSASGSSPFFAALSRWYSDEMLGTCHPP